VYFILAIDDITAEGIAMRQPGIVRRRDSGQSMVEFALILPLLIAFIFGIIELGILFSVYVGMTNSAREAARAGSVYQYVGTPFTQDTPANIKTVDDLRLTYLSQVITNTINPLVNPTTALTRTVTYTPTTPITPYRTGDTVIVQLEHDHSLFFGLFGRQKITIRATSAMRIEPGGTK
jgi:Flp pilus assembly protein TadG